MTQISAIFLEMHGKLPYLASRTIDSIITDECRIKNTIFSEQTAHARHAGLGVRGQL